MQVYTCFRVTSASCIIVCLYYYIKVSVQKVYIWSAIILLYMVRKINLKLNEHTYHRLKNLDDASIDKNLNLLMDTVEKQMPFVPYSNNLKSISAYSDTFERLDKFRLTFGESRDNIITRMLIIYDELNSQEDMEIPFRLTSPLNKKLVILGVCNNSEMSISNEDNSLEYKAWLKLLDWEEIHSIILEYKDEINVSFNKPNYKLDINYV